MTNQTMSPSSRTSSLSETLIQQASQGSSDQAQTIAYLLKTNAAFFLELLTETDRKPTRLEPYQIRFLNDQSKFRLVVKSRQIGFSWIISGEATHKIITTPSKELNVVSINQNEAAKKIKMAKGFYNSIPEASGMKPPLYTNAEYEFGVHDSPDTSYFVSQPASSAIRGGEKDVYFDEFAFIRDSAKLYDAAIPATTRGNSRMTIISTPLGQSGLFFDIASNRAKYPGYTVHTVPWWECSVMTTNVVESTALAASYDTYNRVQKWGTDTIRYIFANMAQDAFQQEYECSFADESVNFYPFDLIHGCVDDTLNDLHIPTGIPVNVGIDIAKKVDKTVMTISSVDEETGKKTIHAMNATQDAYADQVVMFEKLIEALKPQRVTVDATGVGAVIAEHLTNKYGGVVESVVFNLQNKEHWATTFKGDLQAQKVRFPRHRDLLQEIHSIERKKSEAGNYIFKAREGEHDDYYWSAMLSLYGQGRVAPSIGFAW